jgi:hypothetical protein
VGGRSSKEDFLVLEPTIRASAPFFRTAFGRNSKELKERLLKFSEVDPDVFHVYLQAFRLRGVYGRI